MNEYVYVPRHQRIDHGDWPHVRCAKALPLRDAPAGPETRLPLKVYDYESAGNYVEFVADVVRHDGILQPDGTRTFPIDPCMLTYHEHPNGECPSVPRAESQQPPPLVVIATLPDLAPARPHLILIKNEDAA